MPLAAGVRFGPYEILAPLGAGGMGEVYKARDTRLDRTVAIKVLPSHIAAREDVKQRFEREARAVSSLNHPHICVLHDIGKKDDVDYMVMEHLEGETLQSRLTKGSLPLDQALKYAGQVADAVDRAHRSSVVHRDLKPGNIMLTRDGAKVLDFGLAKTGAAKAGTADGATLTAALTSEGTVLGTPQYMSPEQIEGKEADSRSDIFAFGCVLYEMVTGKRAFDGKTKASVIGAILAAEPPAMSALQPVTPPLLEHIVRQCLAKDPDERYQSLWDVRLELRAVSLPIAGTSPRGRRPWLPWAVAAISVIVVLLFASLWLRSSSAPPLPVALTVDSPEGATLASGGSAISPDGRTLAFVATNEKGETLLYVRPLESLAARPLPGTQNASRPFWSPDSKSLAFIAGGKLRRIDLTGSAPVTLCDAGAARGGDWNDEGIILFATNPSPGILFPTNSSPGIQRIPAAGGSPTVVTQVNKEAGETFHYYPQFLPGGRDFFYLVNHRDPAKNGIAFGSLDAKPASPAAVVAQTEFAARYDPISGRILYLQGDGTLVARRLDIAPARLAGDPVTVAEGVATSPANGYADFSLSHNGTLFYSQGSGSENARFVWRDRSGKLLETIGEPALILGNFSLSPDGVKVAYPVGQLPTQPDVWMMDLHRSLSTRITFNKGWSPRWSPDGKSIYYVNSTGILRKPADGSGDEVLLARLSQLLLAHSISPDGKALLFGFDDIMKLSLAENGASALASSGAVEPYLKTDRAETAAAFSPDGRWVAYVSDESGRFEIYIQGYPDRRGKWLVSTSGGRSPGWRQDGKELYWMGYDGTVTAAAIELLPDSVRPGRPQPLFRFPPNLNRRGGNSYVSRDGRRFLTLEPEAGVAERRAMVVILNWAARLGEAR